MPPCLETGEHQWDARSMRCVQCGITMEFWDAGGRVSRVPAPMLGGEYLTLHQRAPNGEIAQVSSFMPDAAIEDAELLRIENLIAEMNRRLDDEFINGRGDGYSDGEYVDESADVWTQDSVYNPRTRMRQTYTATVEPEDVDLCVTCGLPSTSDAHLARCAGYAVRDLSPEPPPNPDRALLEALRLASSG